jgi:hypothetical protein
VRADLRPPWAFGILSKGIIANALTDADYSPKVGPAFIDAAAVHFPGPQLGVSLMVPQGPSAVAEDLGAILRRKPALSAVERANLCRRFHPAGAQWR